MKTKTSIPPIKPTAPNKELKEPKVEDSEESKIAELESELAKTKQELEQLQKVKEQPEAIPEPEGTAIFVCSQPNSSYITQSIQTVVFKAYSRQIGTNADSTAVEITVGIFKTNNSALIAELRALVERSSAFYEVKSLEEVVRLTVAPSTGLQQATK
jgi:hypothetical protein